MTETFGFDEFTDALDRLEKDLTNSSVDLLEDTANHAVAEIQMRTPVDTGTLRRGIARGKVNETNLSVGVGSSINYARPVEEGHRQEPGRFVPAIGKKLKADFVPGHFMIRDGSTVAAKEFERRSEQMIEQITKEFKL